MVLNIILVAAVAFVHLIASRLRFLHGIPRSIYLSIAGGASVSYIFLHLIPQLKEASEEIVFLNQELSIFIIALLGLCFIYGLERYAKIHETEKEHEIFWVHMLSYGIYNFIIGYLIVDYPEEGTTSLLLFFIAMALHFIVNDSGLLFHHRKLYLKTGKWILVAALLAGGVVALTLQVSTHVIHAAEAFIAGGIIMNVLKEELPENRKSRFWAFMVGVVFYAALMIFLNQAS